MLNFATWQALNGAICIDLVLADGAQRISLARASKLERRPKIEHDLVTCDK